MRDTLEERVARTLRRMVPGGFAGRSEQVSPVRQPLVPLSTYRPLAASAGLGFVFDFPGPLIAADTDPVRFEGSIIGAIATLMIVAGSDTTFSILRNGLAVGTVLVTAGNLTGTGVFAADYVITDTMQGQLTIPGSGGAGGTLQPTF